MTKTADSSQLGPNPEKALLSSDAYNETLIRPGINPAALMWMFLLGLPGALLLLILMKG